MTTKDYIQLFIINFIVGFIFFSLFTWLIGNFDILGSLFMSLGLGTGPVLYYKFIKPKLK